MPPRPMVALVALPEARFPPQQAVFERFGQLRPDLPPIVQVERQEDVCSFVIGRDTAAISLMDAPIPWADLERPCATAWYWPEAEASMRDHRAHVLVVVLSDSPDRVATALFLTSLVAAVAECSEANGVCWVPATLVHSPEAFIDSCQEMSKEYLPLYLWVSFAIQQHHDGSYCVFTTGLAEFGLMEIEVHGSYKDPEFLMDRVFNIAHYLLDNGPVLEDGETIGLSDDEEIPVHHGPSMWDERMTVIQLGL
ncbi:MAG: DUF4261 domain-containing protein [Rhodopirellula sp.]|nr:DUF4261 domain-containing protein [Rhodopirellula sp.]